MVSLDPPARRLLDGANYGHLATLMPDGHPKVDPVWVGREGDLILVTTDGRSIKARNVRADARVALSVTARADPYEQLLVRGRVVEVRGDDDLAVLDGFSHTYLGTPFPRRRWSERVVLVIEPAVARHRRSPLRDPWAATALGSRAVDHDVADRIAVEAVLDRYADACDHKDYDLLHEVFAPDGIACYGPDHTVEGGPGPIGAYIATWLDACGPTQHLLGNVEVDVAGDTARAVCRVRALHVGRGAAQGRSYEVFGAYHDELARTSVGWRITRRTMVVHGELGDPAVLGQMPDG